MDSNPYSSPSESEPRRVGHDFVQMGLKGLLFVVLPALGGLIGFVGYLVAASYLESFVMPNVSPPKYTYGQQSGLISLPLSTIIGFFTGFALALFASGFRRSSPIVMLSVALLGTAQTYSMWYYDGIGECSSAIVLYYPIFGFCAIVFLFGILLGVIAAAIPRKTRSIAG